MEESINSSRAQVLEAAMVRVIAAYPGQTPTQTVRQSLGLSQDELAKRSGVSRGTIANLEAGTRPDALLLASVAAALGVPQALLVTR